MKLIDKLVDEAIKVSDTYVKMVQNVFALAHQVQQMHTIIVMQNQRIVQLEQNLGMLHTALMTASSRSVNTNLPPMNRSSKTKPRPN